MFFCEKYISMYKLTYFWNGALSLNKCLYKNVAVLKCDPINLLNQPRINTNLLFYYFLSNMITNKNMWKVNNKNNKINIVLLYQFALIIDFVLHIFVPAHTSNCCSDSWRLGISKSTQIQKSLLVSHRLGAHLHITN